MRRIRLCLVIGCVAAFCVSASRADEAGETLSFRRVYGPVDQIAKWAKEGQRYLPVDATEFEQLLAKAHAVLAGVPISSGVQLLEAEYTAVLEAEQLSGQALLKVEHQVDEPALLDLSPCNLTITEANWASDSARAALGHNQNGDLQVLVNRTAELQLQWSLRPLRNGAGGGLYMVRVPPSSKARFYLDLPQGTSAAVDEAPIAPVASTDQNRQRFVIELGGRKHFTLRLSAERSKDSVRQLALLKQSATYDLSARGLELAIQLNLDVHNEPLPELSFDLDPGLELVDARLADQEIPRTVSVDRASGVSTGTLHFDEPLSGLGRSIRLTAIAKVDMGRRWRLPQVRCRDVYWQEGTATLMVTSPIAVQGLMLRGCRQTKFSQLPAPLVGELLELQYYSSDPSIEIVVDYPAEQCRVRVGHQVSVSGLELSGRSIARFTAKEREHFSLQATVREGWTIDAIESSPQDALSDWNVFEDPQGSRSLEIRLSKAVTPKRPVDLTIVGRRAISPDEQMAAAELSPVEFVNVVAERTLLNLQPSESIEFELSGDNRLEIVDSLKLPSADLQLFSEAPQGQTFAFDSSPMITKVKMVQRRPRFDGEIEIDALVSDEQVTETCLIRCARQTNPISRVLVHFSQTHDVPWDWTVAGGTPAAPVARRLSEEEQRQVNATVEGEIWEVRLRTPRTTAFELRAVRKVPFQSDMGVSLAWLPQATQQRGLVNVRALAGENVSIENKDLRPAPAELLGADELQTVRGTFRYEPGQATSNVSVLRLTKDNAKASPYGAWAWHCELNSRYSHAGESIHLAAYRIQSVGRGSVAISLPPSAKVRSAWTDNEELPRGQIDSAGREGKLRIDLRQDKAFSTIAVEFVTTDTLGGYVSNLQAPFPQLDIPLLATHWIAWLPPGYAALDVESPVRLSSHTALGWRQRLFGMLGRDDGDTFFDPTLQSSWQRLVSTTISTSDGEAVVEDVLAKVQRSLGGAESRLRGPTTWGDLFTQVARQAENGSWVLVFDAANLDRLKLTPTTVVAMAADIAREPVGAVLRRAGLSLIVEERFVLVTSESLIAQHRDKLAPLSGGVGYLWRARGQGDTTVDVLSGRLRSSVSLAAWKDRSAREMSWRHFDVAADNLQDLRGWRACSFQLETGETPRLKVARTATIRSIGWAIFLVVLGLGVWQQSRPAIWVTIAGTCGVLALVLPATIAMLLAPAFLASLAVLLTILLRRLPIGKSADQRASGFRRIASAVPAGAAIIALAMLAQNVFADEITPDSSKRTQLDRQLAVEAGSGEGAPAVPAAKSAAEVHTVFVSVDERGEQIGSNYLVGEAFYNKLYRMAKSMDSMGSGYLIRGAEYRAMLAKQPASSQAATRQLHAQFELLVLTRDARVLLPLGAHASAVGAVTIDGHRAQFKVDEELEAVLVDVTEPGECRLELILDVPIADFGSSVGFDLAVPLAPSALVELTAPAATIQPELVSHVGAMKPGKVAGVVSAQIGPTDKISVRWSDVEKDATSDVNTEVEELIWCTVQPGSVVLDARLKLRGVQGPMGQLRLAIDPRLRLVSNNSGASPAGAVRSLGGNPEVIELELPPSENGQITLDLKFLLTGTSGIGNVRIPRLESASARTTRRLLAVSIDPSLEHDEPPQLADEAKVVTTADFLTAWGETNEKPQLVMNLPRGENNWVLSTRPREPVTSVQQIVALSVGAQSASAELAAQLMTERGQNYQLRIKVPANFEPRSVSCICETAQRVLRWSRSTDDVVTVFLSAPTSGRQQLLLQGALKTSGQSLLVPRFEVLGGTLVENKLILMRQPDVVLSAKDVAQLKPVEPVSHRSSSTMTEGLVGTFAFPEEDTELRWSPNSIVADAMSVITMQRDSEAWFAQLDTQITVREGILDALRFDVPPHWTEPFELDQPADFQLMISPGENRRQLVVRPRAPIESNYRIKVRGKVSMGADDQLQVPDLAPLGLTRLERFVVLPSQHELQQIMWDASFGLVSGTLPDPFALSKAEPVSVYAVQGEQFEASLKSIDRSLGAIDANLMDVNVVWHRDGHWHGIVTFDLKPAGKSNCVLKMPEHARLIDAKVAGLPARRRSLGDGRWNIELGPPQLPQRIEIVFERFAGDDAWNGSVQHIESPRLVDVPVERTLWTVHAEPTSGLHPVGTANAAPSSLELARLENIVELIGSTSEVTAGTSAEEMQRWRRPWDQRLNTSRALLDHHQIVEGISLADELKALGQRLPAIAEQIPDDVSLAAAPGQVVASAAEQPPAITAIFTGSMPQLDLRTSGTDGGTLLQRWRYALDVAGIAVIALLMSRRIALRRWMVYASLAAAALVIWLLMAPSFLGFLLLVLVAIYALVDRKRMMESI